MNTIFPVQFYTPQRSYAQKFNRTFVQSFTSDSEKGNNQPTKSKTSTLGKIFGFAALASVAGVGAYFLHKHIEAQKILSKNFETLTNKLGSKFFEKVKESLTPLSSKEQISLFEKIGSRIKKLKTKATIQEKNAFLKSVKGETSKIIKKRPVETGDVFDAFDEIDNPWGCLD